MECDVSDIGGVIGQPVAVRVWLEVRLGVTQG